MLELPRHGAADARNPASRREWKPAGHAELLDRLPGVPASHLLCGLLALLLTRYGMPYRFAAEQGGGAARAALALLADDPADVTLAQLLATVASGVEDDPGSEPASGLVVAVGPFGTEPQGDLVWIAHDTTVEVRWNPSVFPEPSVRTMTDHLERIVAQLLDDIESPLARLCPLTPGELRVNGGTPERLPSYPPVTLHQLFMLQAWRTPDACALKAGEDSLTYRELDEASNLLAHRLIDAGTAPGDVVAVAGHRSLGLFNGLLAVLKAGAVFLHLDPDLPELRIGQYIEACRPAVVLRTAGAVVPPTGLPEVETPAVTLPGEPGPRTPPDVTVGPESPAYILFTSGSTGLPKGVLRSHRLHASRVFLEQGLYGLGPDDRHLLKLPISAREFLWPLTTGGTAVIAEPGGERDDRYLTDLIHREQISVISIVPSMLRVLTADPRFARCPALRHVFVGGEALPPDLEDQVRAHGYEVHNTYTLTEADYVAHRRGPVSDPAADSTVIGTPLDMRVYLCDEQDRLVPPGLVGEMLVGGPGLASGYIGDPQRTAERFVPNPFGDPDAPVLFRTGDLARHRPDGSLEYRGRRDLQIKVRGHRVEPTEVELMLREHPGVRDAAVAGYPDPEQGAALVAFVVTGEEPPQDGELRAFLTERLPQYMVPRHLVGLPRLPQLPSGKVDRASLEPPARRRPRDLPAPAPAEGPTQAGLVAVWRRVLRTESVGVDDEYTALGGDSLRLMLLRAAIRDELGHDISLADLLRAATVRTQAALIDSPPTGRTTSPRPRGRARAAAADSARRATLRSVAGPVDSRKDTAR